ncbi:hypothetical protein LOZ65_005831 [Ophidiomyces ophidiicola]|nr:hypothetical protein LOZ65_005831 [Ophidiomyces ophidiicola]
MSSFLNAEKDDVVPSAFIFWEISVPNTPSQNMTSEKSHSKRVTELLVSFEPQVAMETPEVPFGIPVNEFCAVKASPGKGRGLFAACDLRVGTHILSDRHIVKIPGIVLDPDALTKLEIEFLTIAISEQLKEISKEKQREFFSLENAHKEALGVFLGTAMTNAMAMGVQAKACGVYLNVSRINHGCRPNAVAIFNDSGEVMVHVMKGIPKGKEITITYIEPALTFSVRKNHLKHKFGFNCTCELCSRSPEERYASDMRLGAIVLLSKTIRVEGIAINEPLETLQNAHALWFLLKEEGIAEMIAPTFYYDAAIIAFAHGDRARTKVFAEKAKKAARLAYGANHTITAGADMLVDDPVAFGLIQKTTRWKQGVDKIPRGLSRRDFDKWLWKKEN